jgi:hypothetical protein
MRIEYVPLTIPDKPGEGAKITSELRKRNINLLALHAFPTTGGKAQFDIVPENMETFQRIAKELGWKLGERKAAFLIQGEDRIGAMADIHERLGDAGISITAATGITAGNGRYACLLWVKPADVQKAARALEVTVGVR